MADINTVIRILMMLSTAIQNSDYYTISQLLRRLQRILRKLRHDTNDICKVILLHCREKELDLKVKYIIEETTRHMSEDRNRSGNTSGSGSDSEDEIDYETRLSNVAAEALQEFLLKQELEDQRLAQAQMGAVEDYQPREDWQLSQFWYDDKTAEILAREALAVAGENGCIACVSSPTVYRKIIGMKPAAVEVKCLEYDEKFQMFGKDFIFYDFNDPLNLDSSLKNHFDVVVADPPFLSEECLTKTAITLKYLAKDKIIMCTGAIMESLAHKLLKVSPCEFRPTHQNHLQNEFMCYTNYESEALNSEH